jgi:hypothetical protein
MFFLFIFEGKNILREKKKFAGFLIKSGNKKKKLLSERLNSKYVNKKFNLKILYK